MEKVIPKGPYCYTATGWATENGKTVLKTIRCPYWERQDGKTRCSFLNKTEDDEGYDLLWDSVKCCNENWDDE
jgi:hypothetical protein